MGSSNNSYNSKSKMHIDFGASPGYQPHYSSSYNPRSMEDSTSFASNMANFDLSGTTPTFHRPINRYGNNGDQNSSMDEDMSVGTPSTPYSIFEKMNKKSSSTFANTSNISIESTATPTRKLELDAIQEDEDQFMSQEMTKSSESDSSAQHTIVTRLPMRKIDAGLRAVLSSRCEDHEQLDTTTFVGVFREDDEHVQLQVRVDSGLATYSVVITVLSGNSMLLKPFAELVEDALTVE
eukprot:TRINITY_DN1449_c0_g1_i1.p2 TRINITY_DN1449_c0_g1~~TRINITY_DN1449_c0_g1_i1.p2  ORF type:complete len:237 (+),score=77.07 TRINITY_DN1449_c0_g1_i1:1260-1970(+)